MVRAKFTAVSLLSLTLVLDDFLFECFLLALLDCEELLLIESQSDFGSVRCCLCLIDLFSTYFLPANNKKKVKNKIY